MQLNKIEIDFDDDSSGGDAERNYLKFLKSFFQNKYFVLITFFIGGGSYYLGQVFELDIFDYLSIPFFVPSLLFLYSEFKETFDEINIVWKVFFILGEFTIIYFLVSSNYYSEYILFELITDYFIFFILFQFFAFIFWLLRLIASSIVYYFTPSDSSRLKGRSSSLIFVFKKMILPIVLIIGFGLLGYRNWQLTQRVSHLESAIGESRLLCDEKEAVKRVKKSTVRIIGTRSEGSGFVFEKKGPLGLGNKYILTNHHVVAKDMTPKIVLPDYTLLQGKVMASDYDSDLAVIEVEEGLEEIESLEFGDTDNLEDFDELIAVGYPLGTAIRGEATVNKGNFVALREIDNFSEEMIQMDIDLGFGMSGGPTIDICGKVYGINTVSSPGFGLSISAKNFLYDKWDEMTKAEDPLADIEKIEIKPNESPLECVKAFYNYQTTGELKKAYDLLSRNYTDWTFERWEKGYEDTLYIVFVKAEEVEDKENTVFVKFYSADLKDEKLVERYFEGEQTVKEYDGQLKLESSNIKEIQEPDWEWFWDFEEEI